MSDEYEVGYRRPPKDTQFEKGRSGNPKGRPKGSRNIATLFNQITLELIQVKENGRTKTMTRLEAVVHQMTNRALSGDARTMREIIQLSRVFQEAEKHEPGVSEPAEKDAAVMASLLKRMERVGQVQDFADIEEPSVGAEPDEEFQEDDDKEYA